ncbi:AsmA family protein [Pontiella sulfatireligans]|uniref:Uncharacterized protein n=1 Tax=Pontiella sulfatireligans TaxID=2750658 RepID=A0A6C2UQR5_9BACT|nr:hypothetical protein [Pontiella sulfatireligans]VGO22558.1 hypothetical protein SCARR_04642 [Pontiella sulfatireligans]
MSRKNTAAKKGSLIGRWKRNLASALIIFLILYIGVHVISRTEGARSAVADKLSNGTGQPIALEKCEATPLLGLRLQGLAFQGVSMPEVKMSFNWFSFLSKDKPFIKQLRIQGLEIQFKRVPASGHWEPLVLHGVGSRLGAVLGLNPAEMGEDESLPKFPPYAINAKTLLQLDRAKVVWRDENGREIAYITEADLKVKSGTFIKRKVIQTIAQCGHVKLASGRALRDFRLEVFRIEGSGVVTVLDMADSNGEYDEFASQTLWQDLNLHLNQLTQVQ